MSPQIDEGAGLDLPTHYSTSIQLSTSFPASAIWYFQCTVFENHQKCMICFIWKTVSEATCWMYYYGLFTLQAVVERVAAKGQCLWSLFLRPGVSPGHGISLYLFTQLQQRCLYRSYSSFKAKIATCSLLNSPRKIDTASNFWLYVSRDFYICI